jgi:hypothetical protein
MSGIPAARRTRVGGTMVAAAADHPVRGGSSATPAVTVTSAGVVIGAGFLPNHEVTVRITRCGEDVSDYLTYASDSNGNLHADLPDTAVTGILQISATDHRPDPGDACGRLWSNAYTLGAGAS